MLFEFFSACLLLGVLLLNWGMLVLFEFLISLGLLAEWLSLFWFCLLVPCFCGWFVFLLQGGFADELGEVL